MSLGWLTESTIIPTKKKAISGITSNSLINLKAALYDQQQQSKRRTGGGGASGSRQVVERSASSLEAKNRGVENRIQRDLQLLRADDYQQSLAHSNEQLKKKAQLYQKMLSGELEESEENQLVDFQMKLFRREKSIGGSDAAFASASSSSSSASSSADRSGPGLLLLSSDNSTLSPSSRTSQHHHQQQQQQQLYHQNHSGSDVFTSSGSSDHISRQNSNNSTESARNLVKKIRKQRKMKIQKRIAKIKKRAAIVDQHNSLTNRVLHVDDYDYDENAELESNNDDEK